MNIYIYTKSVHVNKGPHTFLQQVSVQNYLSTCFQPPLRVVVFYGKNVLPTDILCGKQT
jgi:hypothetical protein